MRKMKKPPAEELRKKKEEPLAEGLQIIVPADSIGRRLWKKLSDEQIVALVRKTMEENGISGRKELERTDRGLYGILHRRGLLGEIEFEQKIRSWKDMSDVEIVRFAQKVMQQKGITGRHEMEKADPGLYSILSGRVLLEEVGFERKRKKGRSWKGMSNDEIIEFAMKVIEEQGIADKGEFFTSDPGLHSILRKRGLLNEVGLERKVRRKRSWKGMSDVEVVDYAKRVMKKKGITGKHKLEKADHGLYNALGQKGLLDRVGFEEKRKEERSWKDMSNEEIVEYARKVMERQGITGRSELDRFDSGLYGILRKRKLLEDVGFEVKRGTLRSWRDMDNDEIIRYAKKAIREEGISGRYELDKFDSGLYSILKRRGLVDRAFAQLDQQIEEQARDAVIDALEAFAANDNNSAEDDVA